MIACYGGIDLGGTFIKAGLLSIDGKPLTNFKIPTEVHLGIPTVKSNLRTAARQLIELSKKDGFSIKGIGIGSPGTIKFPEGKVTGATPNIPGWVGTTITALFSGFETPFVSDNDANCMGLAEATFGAGKGTTSGLYLTLGTGVGGAVFMHGQLIRGASFAAGEFGHTILKYGGAMCKSGRRGCLEGYVAQGALLRNAKKVIGFSKSSILKEKRDSLAPSDIFDAFKKGDRAATAIVSENASMIGVAIGSVVNLLNPEIVVIGGGLAYGGPKYIELIKKAAFAFAFESSTKNLKIKRAKFGNEAGWIGAACLHLG
jgi:glucokinase